MLLLLVLLLCIERIFSGVVFYLCIWGNESLQVFLKIPHLTARRAIKAAAFGFKMLDSSRRQQKAGKVIFHFCIK